MSPFLNIEVTFALVQSYVKSKKEDNMGISPLLSVGKLVSDSAHKAKLLVNQFSSVFTKDDA
jgi:hypothetical protein